MTTKRNLIAALVLTLATFGLGLSPSAEAAGCEGRNHCNEVSSFVAQLTDFRTSMQGSNRQVIATVSFVNKTDRPLIIGYVAGSALGLDEHGNRYTISSNSRNAIRGIGEIKGNTFDSRFTLQPGERSDARFELNWYAAKKIAGVQFELDLAVREIDTVAGNQFRLGREHSLRFTGLSNGLTAAAPAAVAPAAVASAASTGSTSPSASTSTVASTADPCEGRQRCYATGPFLAEVTQLSTSKQGSNHVVQLRVQFRNLSNQPVILAYKENSGSALDNYGQKYTVDWRTPQSVSGIGRVSSSKADPQFVLSPGEARSATFSYRRYVGKTAIGTVFSPDLVVEQLEILPSQQIRSMREYSVSYSGLTAGMTAAAGDPAEALKQIGDGLKSIFRQKN